MANMREWFTGFFGTVGEISLFGLRAIRDFFRPPFEGAEIVRQLYEIGWRSGPLVIVAGFAFGVVLALETRSSMESFGAEAMIPQAVSFGLFKEIGPLSTGIMPMGDRPPAHTGKNNWDGICLVLVAWKK